jgi:CheY-like chemotaxis protein
MRTLLIHNDNLNENLVNSFDEDDILIFSIANQTLLNPNFSFDKEAHDQLKDHFEEYGMYDLIVLPFNLSPDNYLEFSGIQLANHLRLTKAWNHHKTPILFLGEETPYQIAKLMRADILFTQGVFYSADQTFDEITRWANKLDESKFEISEDDYGEIINKLILEPPNDYDSHHNLDNEFSLYLWSKTIGLELAALKREIESGLYFKWWSLKNKIEIDHSVGKLDESANSIKDWSGKKVLLIDDQHEKGWYLFFKKLLPTVEVDFLDGDYQKPDQFDREKNIIDIAIEKIRIFDPHVVLLDLRLTDTDSQKGKSKLTGIKILEKIKKSNTINQGIQVVSLSATDKIWNYKELLKKKVSSFIVKNTDNENSMNQIISEHRKLIYRKIEEADYLKDIFRRLSNLKTLLKESISDEEYEIQKVQLELVFELVTYGISEPKYNNFAFHVLFQVLEGYIKSKNVFEHFGNESYVICKGTKVLVRKENHVGDKQIEVKELSNFKGKITVRQRLLGKNPKFLDTYFIVMSILHIRLGLADSNDKFSVWFTLNEKRNKKTGHGSNEKVSTIKWKDLKDFIEFLTFVFDGENQKETNVKSYVNSFNFQSTNLNQPSGNTLGDLWPNKKK